MSWTVWLFVVATHFAAPARGASTITASEAVVLSAGGAELAGAGKGGGILEGTVKYASDSKRPWKFARYYVHNAKDGALAEAVVALEFSTTPPVSPASPPFTHTMDQVNFQFVPELMAVRAGDSVHFTNSDDAIHNVMTADGGAPFNANVAKGQGLTHTFKRAGGLKEPVRLGCVFHGGMRAWVFVFDHPWFKVTGQDGGFRFEDVPPGSYTLSVLHPAGKLQFNRRVEVKPGAKSAIELSLTPDQLIGAKPPEK